MSIIYESAVPDLSSVILRDPDPEITEWQGRQALRMSGQGACLLILTELSLTKGQIEVDIGAEGAAYPGAAFRIRDPLNYELAYSQPHTSGKWDAIQYDPVFHGSNTWQLYHGPEAQQHAEVPMNKWYRMRIKFKDQSALIQVGNQTPLVVKQLAHPFQSGLIGLWTFRPAYFSNLCIFDDPLELNLEMSPGAIKKPAPGTVTEWFLEGYGSVVTESSGILNLNRFLPSSSDKVQLLRDIEMSDDGDLTFQLGFSDHLVLQIDEEVIFEGENLFKDTQTFENRGYVSLNNQVSHHLRKGVHRLKAILEAQEPFGFGISLSIEGEKYQIRPTQTCI